MQRRGVSRDASGEMPLKFCLIIVQRAKEKLSFSNTVKLHLVSAHSFSSTVKLRLVSSLKLK